MTDKLIVGEEVGQRICLLVTLDELRSSLHLEGLEGSRELEVEALEVWSEYSGSVSVDKLGITLNHIGTTTQPATTTTQPATSSTTSAKATDPLRIEFDVYSTIGEVENHIESLANWNVLRYVGTGFASKHLKYIPETSSTGYMDRVVLIAENIGWLKKLQVWASNMVQNWCGRTFCLQEHTERFSGGESSIYLTNFPVNTIKTLTINGNAVTNYEVDYESGILYYDFPDGTMNIQVTYNSGYSNIPEDLKEITSEVAAIFYHRSGENPKTVSRKVGSLKSSDFEGFLTEDLRLRLEKWRNL